ncbi:MAG: tetraacyldisaccharide 4'-kinase [Deltaproteobacteria bacterium]|nr:tetraacyldisaccharide 4'-kinase [Deltaproteobacteria bacterium]
MGLGKIATRTWRDDRKRARFLPLLLASLLYRSGVTLRNVLYDTGIVRVLRMPCPVISVGNIVVGGTGKTPTVIMLADMLNDRGWKPAVLSRGYGGRRKRGSDAAVVSDGRTVLMDPAEAGDEPVLIAQRLPAIPVIIAGDRSRAGRLAVERFGSDVLILDDGFQHRRMARDIDIVLLDGERPFGNGFLLPRGGMREPHGALRRADALILTSGEEADTAPLETIPSIPVFRGRRRPVDLVRGRKNEGFPLADLMEKRVCAFAGIANPDGFRRMLESLCGEIASFLPFPDHHVYTAGDVENIREVCRDSGAQMMVTTEKDGIKLAPFPDFFGDVCRLRIAMEIVSSGPAFEEYVVTRLKR